MLSLSAAGLYAVVLAACLWAAATAGKYRQPRAHRRMWVGIALVFAVLALLRIGGIEEVLRETFRGELRAEGSYDKRRALQTPLALGVIFSLTGLFVWSLWRQWRATSGRRNFALLVANAALVTMVMLLCLRIVSLHQIDMLLYGPSKLNWVLDIGASLCVMAAAVLYRRYVRQRP
jgi:hypothetical protein